MIHSEAFKGRMLPLALFLAVLALGCQGCARPTAAPLPEAPSTALDTRRFDAEVTPLNESEAPFGRYVFHKNNGQGGWETDGRQSEGDAHE